MKNPNTKEERLKKGKVKILGMVMMLIIICLQFLPHKSQAMAASGIKLYNYTTKKEFTYKDAQVKVTFNGKKISKDSTPGILLNGYALVPYKDVFANSAIKADCVYDKSAGTVTISKYGTKIVLKLGSTTAYVNGNKVTAPIAPVMIKYVKSNVTKILVPSRFVCETLGYKYNWNKEKSTVEIVQEKEPLYLSYNSKGEKFYYTGTQGKVTVDGKAVNLGNMPSIIVANTAMLRAKKVFADSKIKAEYSYNSADKTVTLSKNGNVVKMKIGSPVAYVNGNPVVLDIAPILVKNHDLGTSFVMVPGSFTATSLGYDYYWDNKTVTSVITTRKENTDIKTPDTSGQTPNNGSSNPANNDTPELGDSSVTWDPGKIHYQWESQKDLTGVSSGVQNIDNSTQFSTIGIIYSIVKDSSKSKINSETYAIYGSIPFTKVTSSLYGKQISLNISNMSSPDNILNIQNQSGDLIESVRAYTVDTNNSRLEFNVNAEKFTYDLTLSSDRQVLYVTIYHNYLDKVIIGTNNTMDYITLVGNYPLDVKLDVNDNDMVADITGIKKGFDNQFVNISDAINLHYVAIHNTTTGIQLIAFKDACEYFVTENGNSYTIMFMAKDGQITPTVPNQNDSNLKDDNQYPVDDSQDTDVVIPEYPVDTVNNYELIIPNPAGIKLSQIKHEDQYYKCRIAIRLPGDYVSYFNKYPINVNSKVIDDVSVFLNSNHETEILISTSKIQGYKIEADENFIYVKVGDPKTIYKNIVVLDPGHGGSAPGAYYNNTYEKTLNFKILYEIGKQFFEFDPYNLKVYYTRITDVDVSLDDRAAFAQKVGADLFVSLHMNANTNKSVYGTEVYYSSDNNKPNKAGLTSEILAKLLVNNISYSLGTLNRGTRAAKYVVVHRNTVPAVLIELAFMSNQNDFKKISNPDFQYNAAKTIYETILQVFELYPTGR